MSFVYLFQLYGNFFNFYVTDKLNIQVTFKKGSKQREGSKQQEKGFVLAAKRIFYSRSESFFENSMMIILEKIKIFEFLR
jgi:hypothetical protein